jgi:hypothetical protein
LSSSVFRTDVYLVSMAELNYSISAAKKSALRSF